MSKRKKKILVAVVVVLVIVAVGWIWLIRQEAGLPRESLGNAGTETESQEETEPQEETESPENTVASLSAGNVDGSCVILYAEKEKYIVATASHVVAGKTEKVWFAGQEVWVRGYWRSKDYDLSFLEIELDNPERIADLETAKINVDTYGETKAQEEIHIYGMVAGEKVYQKGVLLNNWIYIEDFGYHMLWAEAENIKGGMSGGGVFDSKGRLMGMLLGSDGDSQIVALPISILAGEWESSDLAGAIDIFSN